MFSLQVNATTTPYNFFNITTNNIEASTIGAQFLVNVSDPTEDQVLFEFYNNIGIASSICDVYFDDGSLLGISTITSSAGVAFSSPATPGNLPGGNNADPDFVTTDQFSADSDPPVNANGINNPGEWLGILFDLQTGRTYADVISNLSDGSLRIGLHVQAIGVAGGSDSFINQPTISHTPIPEPGTFLLFGTGLVGLAVYRYRRSKKK